MPDESRIPYQPEMNMFGDRENNSFKIDFDISLRRDPGLE
jgi:hypothetical protein